MPAWGSPDRYYAVARFDSGEPHAVSGPSLKRIQEALLRDNADLPEKVERAVKRWNPGIREALRSEMGLRLAGGEEKGRYVPVRVADGLPRPLEEVLAQFDPDDLGLLLKRDAIAAVAPGLEPIVRHHPRLTALFANRPIPTPDSVKAVQDAALQVAKYLATLEVEQRLGAIVMDVLGAYFFRRGIVLIYWTAIGAYAEMLGIAVEALTVLVLTHELAHAYSHLGRDIDSVQWETEAYAKADHEIVEGLAQFYTGTVAQRLRDRFPPLLQAYEQLLRAQSGPYLEHTGWILQASSRGETVRGGMVHCRTLGVTNYRAFLQTLDQYANSLGVKRRR